VERIQVTSFEIDVEVRIIQMTSDNTGTHIMAIFRLLYGINR